MGLLPFERIKKITVTLRFSILSIFLSLFTIAILILISFSYLHAKNSMLYTANQLMASYSKTIVEQIDSDTNDAAQELLYSVKLIQENALDVNDEPQLVAYLTSFAKRYDMVEAAFWVNEEGKMVMADVPTSHASTITVLNANKDPYEEVVKKYDAKGKLISQQTLRQKSSQDPRMKVWYRRAKEEKKVIWTNIHPLEYTSGLGITWAIPVYNANDKLIGVIGLDISLDTLAYFIEQQKIGKNGFVFIVSKKGSLVAFPKLYKLDHKNMVNIHDLSFPWLGKSFDIYAKTKNKEFSFNYESESYLARYEPIIYFADQGWSLGVVVPQDDFIGELKKTNALDILVGIFILLIGSLLISGVISLIIKPIKKLVKQTEKIKHFDLDENIKIHSRIKEVILLSDALYAMRNGLKSFQKYVPASLVRQLIDTGDNARIGGVKKPLSILFSDIKNFTTIAENMNPNLLMEYICEYFDKLSKIISDENGTIDKYIGDSIMAFWGAPIVVGEPSLHAARAALKCKISLDKLNIEWREQGREPLITRFGVHAGDAIVGNVGSSERLNYTALGDAINMASRLESANKIYGTLIIVSETVYQQIKNKFILRFIDRVAFKGKAISEKIYELIAENDADLPFNREVYQTEFERGYAAYQQGKWDEALVSFEKCVQLYPQDTIAPVFIKRIQTFQLHPPLHWDGIWRVEGL